MTRVKIPDSIGHHISWSIVSRFGKQAVQLITTFVLARLISPGDFGLIGMTMVFLNFASLFQDMGTASSVIQVKETNQKFLSTVYWLNVFSGFLILVIFYFTAKSIALFYKEPQLESIIYTMSWIFPITALSSVQGALMERELGFKKLSIMEITATMAGSIAGIGGALLGMGPFSLVFQSLVLCICTTIGLFILCKWKPRFHFSLGELKKIYKFSLNLTGYNIFNYFSRNADYFLIGKFLGKEALGLYTFAYNLMLVPLRNISGAIGRVLFPVLSKLQDDHHAFRETYLQLIKKVAFFTFPIVIGILAVSTPFFTYFLGGKWVPALPLVFILTPLGLIQSIINLTGAIYTAKGRTDLQFKWNVIFGVFIILSFVIGLNWGVTGVASAYMIAALIIAYPNLKIPYNLVQLKPFNVFKTILPSLGITIVMGIVVYYMGFAFNWETLKAVKLIALVLTGMAFYFGMSYFITSPIISHRAHRGH